MNKKIKIIFIGIILILGYGLIMKKYFTPTPTIIHYSQPSFDEYNKPIILWDIHDVIIKKDIKKIMNTIWQFEHKLEIIRNLSLALCTNVSREALKALFYGSTGEEFVVTAQHYGNNALADLVMRVANAQTFIPKTVGLIKKLHTLGYSQHIGSNIGKSTFAQLRSTPYFASLFNETYFDLQRSQVVKYSAENPDAAISKPNKHFFTTYLEKNNLNPAHVVLIDDKIQNVATAQHVDIHALLFTNVEQLQRDLWLLLGLSDFAHFARKTQREQEI